MSANDKLRDAAEKAVGHFDAGQFAAGDAVLREALAASEQEPQMLNKSFDELVAERRAIKTEPQAQAEPEVVAWWFQFPDARIAPKFDTAQHGGNWKPLITLRSHREAMEAQRKAIEFEAWELRERVVPELRNAIAKKDAALDACALPESYTCGTCLSYPGRRAEVTLHFSSIEDADLWFAAITQAKEARK